MEAIKRVFPYGQLLPVEFQAGGMRASSGMELPELGGDELSDSCIQHQYGFPSRIRPVKPFFFF